MFTRLRSDIQCILSATRRAQPLGGPDLLTPACMPWCCTAAPTGAGTMA